VRIRRSVSATFGAWAGTAAVSCGLASVLLAGTHASAASAATTPCATRPASAARVASTLNSGQDAATALAVSASEISSKGSPSTSQSSTSESSPSPSTSQSSPSPSTSQSSPSPSTSPSKSASPSPSKSASPSPSPSKSPSPSPSPSKSPTPSQLCVSVQSFSSNAQVRGGHTASYAIWVWSTGGSTEQVTVRAATWQAKGVGTPRFSACPDASGTTCAVGNLPQGQADELQAQVAVANDARPGDHVTLAADASAKDAISFSASGSVTVVSAATPSPSPSHSTTSPVPSISSVLPLAGIPGVPSPPSIESNPSGLFPTVSPQQTASPAAGVFAGGRKNSRGIRAIAVSDTLPLNTRLIGGQLAGLVVLAAAIAIAITRLSVRPRRPQEDNGSADK